MLSLPSANLEEVLSISLTESEFDASRVNVMLDLPSSTNAFGESLTQHARELGITSAANPVAASGPPAYAILLSSAISLDVERGDEQPAPLNLTGLSVQWNISVNLTGVTLIVDQTAVSAASLSTSVLATNLYCLQLTEAAEGAPTWSRHGCLTPIVTAASPAIVVVSCTCEVPSATVSASASVGAWSASPLVIPSPPDDPDLGDGTGSSSALPLGAWLGIGLGSGAVFIVIAIVALTAYRRRSKRKQQHAAITKTSSEVALAHVSTLGASSASLPVNSSDSGAEGLPESTNPAQSPAPSHSRQVRKIARAQSSSSAVTVNDNDDAGTSSPLTDAPASVGGHDDGTAAANLTPRAQQRAFQVTTLMYAAVSPSE